MDGERRKKEGRRKKKEEKEGGEDKKQEGSTMCVCGRCMHAQVSQSYTHFSFKRLCVCEIENQDNALCTSIEARSHCAEAEMERSNKG